ncbi:MAG: hypothetical protein WBA89_12480 [Microcoleus sp.]
MLLVVLHIEIDLGKTVGRTLISIHNLPQPIAQLANARSRKPLYHFPVHT